MLTSNTYDGEFREVLTLKPRRYAVSYLRSQRDDVIAKLRADEEKATASVESAAAAVLSARLDYLERGLHHDWAQADKVAGAYALLEDEQHLWSQKWVRQQEEHAAEAVTWLTEKQLRMRHLSNWAQWQSEGFEMVKFICDKNACSRNSIYLICLYDLNAPYARTKSRVKTVAGPSYHA